MERIHFSPNVLPVLAERVQIVLYDRTDEHIFPRALSREECLDLSREVHVAVKARTTIRSEARKRERERARWKNAILQQRLSITTLGESK